MEEAVSETVKTGKVDMVDEDRAYEWLTGRGVIPDAVARTIAAWWQSPGPWGQYLASLASGAEVRADDLMEAIAREVEGWMDAHALAQWVREKRKEGADLPWRCGSCELDVPGAPYCTSCGGEREDVEVNRS